MYLPTRSWLILTSTYIEKKLSTMDGTLIFWNLLKRTPKTQWFE